MESKDHDTAPLEGRKEGYLIVMKGDYKIGNFPKHHLSLLKRSYYASKSLMCRKKGSQMDGPWGTESIVNIHAVTICSGRLHSNLRSVCFRELSRIFGVLHLFIPAVFLTLLSG
jgi:hypothetical protein